jgi:hypothetical protein
MTTENIPTQRRPPVGADQRLHLAQRPIVMGRGLAGMARALSPWALAVSVVL